MRIGICTGARRPPDDIEGLDYVEPSVGALLCPAEPDAAFAERCKLARDAPVQLWAANCLLPGELKTTGPEVDADALDRYMHTVCARAKVAGVKRLVFGSGGSRSVPDGFDHGAATDQLVDHLTRWAPLADEADLLICLEPLGPECNIINAVADGARLVERVDRPSVRLLVDTYHMGRNGETPEDIARAKGLVEHVHCAEQGQRRPPGKAEDLRGFFRALKDIGYDGSVSIEAKWEDFDTEVGQAVKALREQIETA